MRFLFPYLLVLLTAGCSVNIGVPTTPGSFVEAPRGARFQPIDTLDPRNAMVYIYRPGNRWGYEELQAPTFFINDQMLFGLKAGAYSWLELHEGEYDFYARRPLSVLFLKTVFETQLRVEGGKSYFLRYSEDRPLTLEEITPEYNELLQVGPLQQVPDGYGMREISRLRSDEPGIYYAGTLYQEPRWAPFFTYTEPVTEGETPVSTVTERPSLVQRLMFWQR